MPGVKNGRYSVRRALDELAVSDSGEVISEVRELTRKNLGLEKLSERIGSALDDYLGRTGNYEETAHQAELLYDALAPGLDYAAWRNAKGSDSMRGLVDSLLDKTVEYANKHENHFDEQVKSRIDNIRSVRDMRRKRSFLDSAYVWAKENLDSLSHDNVREISDVLARHKGYENHADKLVRSMDKKSEKSYEKAPEVKVDIAVEVKPEVPEIREQRVELSISAKPEKQVYALADSDELQPAEREVAGRISRPYGLVSEEAEAAGEVKEAHKSAEEREVVLPLQESVRPFAWAAHIARKDGRFRKSAPSHIGEPEFAEPLGSVHARNLERSIGNEIADTIDDRIDDVDDIIKGTKKVGRGLNEFERRVKRAGRGRLGRGLAAAAAIGFAALSSSVSPAPDYALGMPGNATLKESVLESSSDNDMVIGAVSYTPSIVSEESPETAERLEVLNHVGVREHVGSKVSTLSRTYQELKSGISAGLSRFRNAGKSLLGGMRNHYMTSTAANPDSIVSAPEVEPEHVNVNARGFMSESAIESMNSIRQGLRESLAQANRLELENEDHIGRGYENLPEQRIHVGDVFDLVNMSNTIDSVSSIDFPEDNSHVDMTSMVRYLNSFADSSGHLRIRGDLDGFVKVLIEKFDGRSYEERRADAFSERLESALLKSKLRRMERSMREKELIALE